MTATVPVAEGDTSSPGSSRRGRHRRRIAALVVTVSLLIVVSVAAVIASTRWTNPAVFLDGGAGSFSLTAQPLRLFPAYVGFGTADSSVHETLTVNSAEIHFAKNSAHFKATVVVCTQRPVKEGSLRVGGAFAAEQQGLSQYCTAVRPVKEGTKVRLGNVPDQYLIAVFTPSRAGSAHIDSIDVNYSRDAHHLFQRGTQHTEQDFTIAAKQ